MSNEPYVAEELLSFLRTLTKLDAEYAHSRDIPEKVYRSWRELYPDKPAEEFDYLKCSQNCIYCKSRKQNFEEWVTY